MSLPDRPLSDNKQAAMNEAIEQVAANEAITPVEAAEHGFLAGAAFAALRDPSEEGVERAAMYLAASDREIWERLPEPTRDAYRSMFRSAALAARQGEGKR